MVHVVYNMNLLVPRVRDKMMHFHLSDPEKKEKLKLTRKSLLLNDNKTVVALVFVEISKKD